MCITLKYEVITKAHQTFEESLHHKKQRSRQPKKIKNKNKKLKQEEIHDAKNRRKLQIKTINNSELREDIPTIYLKSEQTKYYEK